VTPSRSLYSWLVDEVTKHWKTVGPPRPVKTPIFENIMHSVFVMSSVSPAGLWDALTAFDGDSQAALFAHCASLTVNVVKEPWNRRPGALAHGALLARAVNLDMAASGWRPTVDNYLGRVPKVRILEAVREAKGEQSAQLIDHLKKADMAKEAERLLEGTGWVPEPLRLSDVAPAAEPTPDTESEPEALPTFLADREDVGVDAEEPQAHAVAAE
jgi:ParB family chromosome partitioning protein